MRKKSYEENQSLDEKIRLDKSNYELRYESISLIEPKRGMLGKSKSEIIVHYLDREGKPREAEYSLGKQMADFKSVLPWINGLRQTQRSRPTPSCSALAATSKHTPGDLNNFPADSSKS